MPLSRDEARFDELLGVLERISSSLESIERKLDQLITIQSPPEKPRMAIPECQPLDVMTLLTLSDHLRKTAMTICKLGKATASDVSKETKRARAVESSYLNQLVGMGHLKRERKGRDVYFYA